ncbi:hypothetical protein DCAR_0207495 [Daucus carota subsp. sativus]|uniref:Uncharacterized protein n=1 Tax=Daucus carota subsp. sativus TaxID=79200 RepID=A0AAF1AQ81_DAUCS|nr:hypothetical protein DCAR_0207495 [Daucus carota subsp. sativus]
MSFHSVYVLSDPKCRSFLWNAILTVSLLGGVYFIGNAFPAYDFRAPQLSIGEITGTKKDVQTKDCKNQCRSLGSEALPKGIVAKTSNLEMRPLWGNVQKKSKRSENLLAIAVGVKQKEVVNQIVQKFLGNGFDVMLFHYDGLVDEWNDLIWSSSAIHVSAMNQTKWWFAKRFLHPDIVVEYDYIFLWDEDLGVENFNPKSYLAIVRSEGLEISQPALDPAKSEVHHQITARRRRVKFHRRYYKFKGGGRCDDNSKGPPCVGWVEMMAPVFSRAAWRCAWYMVQNDLIHAWGLDMKLGYCAQGDRALNVGVVDSEYIVHMGLPTLGALNGNQFNDTETSDHSQAKHVRDSEPLVNHLPYKLDNRSAVRRQSYNEMKIFRKRWDAAVKEDQCFIDPYQEQPSVQKSH